MIDLYGCAVAALRFLPPESAHRVTILGLRSGLGPRAEGPDDPILAQTLWNLDFPNPIGLAAGFDKRAEAMGPMLAAGFGFVEAGTVTPLPQPGNPRPRVFRLDEDGAAINRMGFNSDGLARFTGRVARRRRPGIVGANVGKNRDSADAAGDYAIGVETLAPYVDYLTVNISSPNTPGLRDLQGRGELKALIERVLTARRRALPDGPLPPLLVKISPDLDDDGLRGVADVVLAMGVDGLILGNTTIERPATLRSAHAHEAGGLSGRPLFDRSTRALGELHRLTGGRIPLVGCGGVASGEDAYNKIRAGASLVQLYTALVYRGPRLVDRIKRDLADRLRGDGFASITDAVGANLP